MKKARKSRSKSPSKRVQFIDKCSIVKATAAVLPGSVSLTGYVQRVRRALRHRPDDYRELTGIISNLQRSQSCTTDADRRTEQVISQIERAVALLDCRPELISGLRMFLPPQYSIDVQSDAVVVKEYATQDCNQMTDTGHCIPIDTLQSTAGSLSQSSASNDHPQTESRRSRSCSSGRQFSGERQDANRCMHQDEDRLRQNSLGLQDAHVSGTINYVMDVKRALVSQPEIYRRFAEILHRYHDHRKADTISSELHAADLHAIRQIVSLLSARPQLVLGFNNFLPDGYRIRMFDHSGYVIEYPDVVNGVGRLTVSV